jgi:hypothetical protein
MTRRIDALPLVAAALALVMAWLYVLVVHAQGEEPAGWVVLTLVVAGVGAAYGTDRTAPRRRAVLGLCASVLGALGLLALLSVGLPILVAAALCLLAVARSDPRRHPTRVD